MRIPADLMREAASAAEIMARQLSFPEHASWRPWQAQSLAEGAAGIALLHIERAHVGAGSWKTAHAWVKAATCCEISAADRAGLCVGAPAIAFVLHTAEADGTPRYRAALTELDACVEALAHRRVDQAMRRIKRDRLPAFAEYDLLHGLTGIGAHLLSHAPDSDALGRILAYLVRLPAPLHVDGPALPGWWTVHDPSLATSAGFPGGHGNLGLAHGVSGPLALLAQAMRRGITVDGQFEAISGICAFLDSWQQESSAGPWWPQWVTRHDLRTGQTGQPGPARPSWCYGTPGIARAQQVAAIATGDTRRRQVAEHALAACLADPTQLSQVTGTSLCHGWAGVYQIAVRAAGDALSPQISAHLPRLADLLTQSARSAQGQVTGLLQGKAGLALALHTAARSQPPASSWDAFLLIS